MKVEYNPDHWECKVGDFVVVDYIEGTTVYKWSGLCTWTDGYKYSFLTLKLGEITWTSHDLAFAKAEVNGGTV